MNYPIPFAAVFSLLFGWSMLATSCKNDLASIQKVFPPESLNVEEIRNFEMLYSDSAKVRVRIKGPVMWRHLDEKNPRQEFPEGIEVEFFDAYFRVTSRLTSRYAVRFEGENKIIVRDSVVWTGQNNEQLETEELIWEEQAKKVYTNRFVVVRRNEEIIWGHGFESDQDFSRSRVKAIEGRIKVEDLPGKEPE
ncbi:MAG: LPS export ABC transporter periplasmic protein LptC [Saprospirales bacterium]|nr:LPS export ABC transporter periplasmic protein LptC [Saprospirales bacterium]MBK8489555.1 LPS export ABC transporter periplasmic protein LptC [Saprospirales bacterium]